MSRLIEFINTDVFLLIIGAFCIVILLLCIISIIKFSKLNKRYNNFIKKMSNEGNFEEILKAYMNRVNDVSEKNEEIIKYCKKLDNNISKCIKKVGIVRYNAFKDTGSDLSFALALLNDEDTGVVLNGIYSREMSNIYAKPIQNGKSSYTVSEQEQEAINKAINSKVIKE